VSETIRRAGLAPNTLEINQVRASLYAPIDASEHVALYLIAPDRMVKAGVPITVITVDSCIAGEQLARCAHDRLIERGYPSRRCGCVTNPRRSSASRSATTN
jgi:hypothetical protein